MTIEPQLHWMMRLRDAETRRKGRVLHLAVDAGGEAATVTLCGNRYDSGDSIEASKGIRGISAQGCCTACLRLLGTTHTQLRELFLAAGNSNEVAVALADDILKFKKLKVA